MFFHFKVGDCLSLLVKAAVKHTNKDHCQTLLESLLTEVEVAKNALEKQLEIEEEPKISIGDYHSYVGFVLGLLKIVIDWNYGKFISSHWQSILKVMKLSVGHSTVFSNIAASCTRLLKELMSHLTIALIPS